MPWIRVAITGFTASRVIIGFQVTWIGWMTREVAINSPCDFYQQECSYSIKQVIPMMQLLVAFSYIKPINRFPSINNVVKCRDLRGETKRRKMQEDPRLDRDRVRVPRRDSYEKRPVLSATVHPDIKRTLVAMSKRTGMTVSQVADEVLYTGLIELQELDAPK